VRACRYFRKKERGSAGMQILQERRKGECGHAIASQTEKMGSEGMQILQERRKGECGHAVASQTEKMGV
jgi:hypothetical protein